MSELAGELTAELTVAELKRQLALDPLYPIDGYLVRILPWHKTRGREPLVVDHADRVVYILGIAEQPKGDWLTRCMAGAALATLWFRILTGH